MTTSQTEHRCYFVSKNDERKMVPFKYIVLFDEVSEAKIDFKKVRLTDKDRFYLELLSFFNHIRIDEPYVYELIEGQKPVKVFHVESKFYDGRYEILLGKHCLKCPEVLFRCADEKIKDIKHSNT